MIIATNQMSHKNSSIITSFGKGGQRNMLRMDEKWIHFVINLSQITQKEMVIIQNHCKQKNNLYKYHE